MNMNMYKTKKNEMPVAGDPTMLLVDNYLSTRQMLSNLIEMYRMESQLKKHHKAYLHVREKADMMCDFYEVLLAEMDGRELVEAHHVVGHDVLGGHFEQAETGLVQRAVRVVDERIVVTGVIAGHR